MSPALKPLTGSLKVKVKVTGPVAVPVVLSVIASVGATPSEYGCTACAATFPVPATSTAAFAGTSTVIWPLVSGNGVTTSV